MEIIDQQPLISEKIIQSRKSNMEEQKKLIKSNKKSIQSSKFQMDNIQDWIIEDKKYINNSLSIQDISKFVSGNFEIIDLQNERFIKQSKKLLIKVSDWEKIQLNSSLESVNNSTVIQTPNIILKNKIIKLETPNFNLRSINIEISLYMGGESCIWIFTRSLDKFTNDNVICYINKELESVRKFISFALFEETDQNQFTVKTLKKQEIPKHDMIYNSNLDISELKIRFIDNGDNKCYVYVENEATLKSFFFGADFFCPINGMTNIFIGASGDLISIKSMNIKQGTRFSKDYSEFDQLNKKAQQCTCCNVF